MTKELKKAIKRICEDYDFEDYKEIKEYARDMYGDRIDDYWYENINDEESCYKELERAVSLQGI